MGSQSKLKSSMSRYLYQRSFSFILGIGIRAFGNNDDKTSVMLKCNPDCLNLVTSSK